MENSNLVIRMSTEEKKALKEQADVKCLTLSDYVKLKLFQDNTDLIEEGIKCISPSGAIHETLVAVSCKTIEIGLTNFIRSSLGITSEEADRIMKKSQDLAKERLKPLGYRIIKGEE